MMPRGEVGLIFLGLGTSAKLLTPSLEAAILLMVIGTTFLAPVLLRIVLKDKPPNDGNKISDDVAADPVGLLWEISLLESINVIFSINEKISSDR